MKDFKAIANTIKNRSKERVFGKSSFGNIEWEKASFEWYENEHKKAGGKQGCVYIDFKRYVDAKREMMKTVLEVGCGGGVYPIKYHELFDDLQYTGNDFSENNIENLKKRSKFNFIAGDFIKMDMNQTYDLVFSHAVIDHVYDIDTFLSNVVKSCKKYAYVTSYEGYFPDLDNHKMNWRDEQNCYFNNISVKQIEDLLLKNDLNKNQITLKSIKDSYKHTTESPTQLVIEIDKTV
jgi:ubiquinone/menaquinone biosynthesis C-methylase UbiE